MEGFSELKHSFSIFYCSKPLGNSKLHLCANALSKKAWDLGGPFNSAREIYYTTLTYSD